MNQIKRTVKGNPEISLEVISRFEKEIIEYATQLNNYLNGKPKFLFGSVIKPKMPIANTTEITEKYINIGAQELISKGVKKLRAKAVSKHIFKNVLNRIMEDISEAPRKY